MINEHWYEPGAWAGAPPGGAAGFFVRAQNENVFVRMNVRFSGIVKTATSPLDSVA